jgi:hypothetical protein
MTMIISGSDGVTFPDSTNQFSGGAFSFKNRILNGDMRIDQRNAGAAVTPTVTGYTIDRWQVAANIASKASFDQTTTAPTGFTNSMLITSLSAYSVSAGDILTYRQQIEGFNCADLGWGTASAKTITVSFWVRSSLTGTFGGSVKNGGNDRSYPFTYSISVADTWEQKSVTIAGDTSGTWATDNTSGLILSFGIGVGSTTSGTAGAWAGTNYNSATGAVSVIGTLNATWYVTGVQLEVGSVATPFERRPFGTELALCQRYYQKITTGVTDKSLGIGFYYTSSIAIAQIPFQTYMRAAPTLDVNSGTNYFILYTNNVGDTMNTVSLNDASQYTAGVVNNSEVSGTAGMAGQFKTNNASASLAFSAEL